MGRKQETIDSLTPFFACVFLFFSEKQVQCSSCREEHANAVTMSPKVRANPCLMAYFDNRRQRILTPSKFRSIRFTRRTGRTRTLRIPWNRSFRMEMSSLQGEGIRSDPEKSLEDTDSKNVLFLVRFYRKNTRPRSSRHHPPINPTNP